ncbi:hypothetical protein ACFCYF_01965 [Streptomyces chartreusis]|uniref:hypothetical protein n=1 Tax=Streptomyces TaxID=1883 RepID=UPI002E7FBA80|nr:hypothetical protein [Streptomyces chartreusis]WUB18299.1 hypothetical protein OG997_16925 [Streptomyces chartreusis]
MPKSITFADRLDRRFELTSEPGEYIHSVLARNHIPVDAVVVRRNGDVIDDWQERIDAGAEYRIEMVRAYHLPDFLSLTRLWDTELASGDWRTREDAYYTKRHFMHSGEGDYDATQVAFNREEYVQYVEQLFVDGVHSKGLITDDDKVLLAVSGGKDSLALGYFLSRTAPRLPEFDLQTVHVTTFSKPLDTSFAQSMAEQFGHPLTLVHDDEVQDFYRLAVSPKQALAEVKYKYDASYSIASVHSMMRCSIERTARSMGISKIAFGLMREDICTSIIKSMFVGFPFGGSYRKQQGDIEMVYPLWPIGKKELTLYLEALFPTNNKQGSPVTFERGELARDIHYMIVDTLETILPGAGFQLFEGHQRLVDNFLDLPVQRECENCRMTFSIGAGAAGPDDTICELCLVFQKLGLLR